MYNLPVIQEISGAKGPQGAGECKVDEAAQNQVSTYEQGSSNESPGNGPS